MAFGFGVNPLLWHKALPLFVLPVGVCLLLMLGGVWWRRRALVAAAAGVLLLFGTPAAGDALLRTLENRYPYLRVADCPQADAVVVLGGILQMRRQPVEILEWAEAVDRFERGVELILAGKARYLVLSRVRPLRPEITMTEGHHLRAIALRRGVPEDAIILTREVVNTASEADSLRELARERAWKSILLVTSAFHMPRAMMLFRRAGVQVTPVPVDYQTGDPEASADFSLHDYIPQGDGLARSEQALREYLGMAAYSAVGLWKR
jgi:uncharacterized SAM-binding protein YcdF (DUF218 family)